MTYNKYPKGSEWAKWDLQVQPIKNEWLANNNSDILNKIQLSTEEYLKQAIKKGISVIGITDHNNGTAIDFAFNFAENENIQILAGVELDTTEGWHLLILFNPNLKERFNLESWKDVVNHILGNYAQINPPFYKENSHISKKIGLSTIEFILKIYNENIGLVVFAHCKSNDGFFQKSDVQGRKDVIDAFIDNRFKFIFEIKDKYEQKDEILNTIKG